MTFRSRMIKTGLFLIVLIYYVGGYLLLNEITSHRAVFYHLDLPLDHKIPFVPPFILAYYLVYVFFVLAYWVVQDLNFFKKVAIATSLCISMHFVMFLVFPVECSLRSTIDPNQSWAHLLVNFYYWMDLPYNCFPSLHVSSAFLVAFMLQRYRKGLGWILHPLAFLVALSVLFLKQHYIADVFSGFFIGWFVYRQVFSQTSSN